MTMQSTSIEAFHSRGGDDEGGGSSTLRHNILEVLKFEGPLTSNEVIYKLVQADNRPLSRRGRFKQLLGMSKGEFNVLWHMGCIRPIEKRKCSISERNCAVWKSTGSPQIKLPKRPQCPECTGTGFLDWEDWIMEDWFENNKGNEPTTKEK